MIANRRGTTTRCGIYSRTVSRGCWLSDTELARVLSSLVAGDFRRSLEVTS